jgi:glucokinase
VSVVAGVDLGGTAVNYTLVNDEEKFLVEGLCEHPSLAKQGPEICLQQIADGLQIAVDKVGVALADVVALGRAQAE